MCDHMYVDRMTAHRDDKMVQQADCSREETVLALPHLPLWISPSPSHSELQFPLQYQIIVRAYW